MLVSLFVKGGQLIFEKLTKLASRKCTNFLKKVGDVFKKIGKLRVEAQ
jgi:hypothetical protein